MSKFHTDALNPSALPTGLLGHRRRQNQHDRTARDDPSGPGGQPLPLGARNDLELDKVAEAWNVRIDKEVKAVAGGLKELVAMADIGTTPHPHTPQPTSLHLKLLTSSLIRSAQSLRDIAHELKLTLVLGDEVELVRQRDEEARNVRREVERRRGEVAGLIVGLEGGAAVGADVDVGAGDELGAMDGEGQKQAEGEGEGPDARMDGGSNGDEAGAVGDDGNGGDGLAGRADDDTDDIGGARGNGADQVVDDMTSPAGVDGGQNNDIGREGDDVRHLGGSAPGHPGQDAQIDDEEEDDDMEEVS